MTCWACTTLYCGYVQSQSGRCPCCEQMLSEFALTPVRGRSASGVAVSMMQIEPRSVRADVEIARLGLGRKP